MKSRVFVLSAALALFSLGCTSDETAICERLDECNVVFNSLDDCEDWVEDVDDPDDCRECVEEEDCGQLLSCVPDCET